MDEKPVTWGVTVTGDKWLTLRIGDQSHDIPIGTAMEMAAKIIELGSGALGSPRTVYIEDPNAGTP